MASYRVGLPSGSPPPVRAATSMFLTSFANSLPRLASRAAFLCLVVAHLEWPAISPPSLLRVYATSDTVRTNKQRTARPRSAPMERGGEHPPLPNGHAPIGPFARISPVARPGEVGEGGKTYAVQAAHSSASADSCPGTCVILPRSLLVKTSSESKDANGQGTPSRRSPAAVAPAASTTTTNGAFFQASTPPTATPAGLAQPANSAPSSSDDVATSAASSTTADTANNFSTRGDNRMRERNTGPATRNMNVPAPSTTAATISPTGLSTTSCPFLLGPGPGRSRRPAATRRWPRARRAHPRLGGAAPATRPPTRAGREAPPERTARWPAPRPLRPVPPGACPDHATTATRARAGPPGMRRRGRADRCR